MQEVDVPSPEEAWVNSACSPVHPDFSTWTRHAVAGVSIATPPGWIVEQGPPTNILIRNAARRSRMIFEIHAAQEAKRSFDLLFYRQRQHRFACRASLSGYPAEVIGSFDRGQYSLIAFWKSEWGGKDDGKWLSAFITSPRVEEAIQLRAVLHTMRPVSEAGKGSP